MKYWPLFDGAEEYKFTYLHLSADRGTATAKWYRPEAYIKYLYASAYLDPL